MGIRTAAVRVILATSCAMFAISGCRTGNNYTEPRTPRYASDVAGPAACAPTRGSLLVVSFNVEFAKNVEGAAAILSDEPSVRCADVVLLQEMDADGAAYIANRLGLSHRYYPAVYSKRTERDFGNAVLSRWPIVEDEKILLPDHSLLTGTQRIATAATLNVHGDSIRVYSIHLGTIAEIGPGSRDRQLAVVAADAEGYDRVIIGGDMNSRTVGHAAQEQGYAWPTQKGPPTTSLGRWDHVFLKGFAASGQDMAGTVMDVDGVSDHRPVWVMANLGTRDNRE